MQQLGESFIQTFLLPYVKNEILSNIDKDVKLQHIFKFGSTPTSQEVSSLEAEYFEKSGSILQYDTSLRKVFWKEFIDFVQTQKNLSNGSKQTLAYRLLPDPDKKSFSKEADNNIAKFSFITIKAFEAHMIEDMIKQKETGGEIDKTKAEEDRSLLKEGKLVMLKKDKEKFDYASDPQIRNAISNVERAAKLLGSFKTEKTNKGPQVTTLNPTEITVPGVEVTSSLQDVQKNIWETQAALVSKDLEKSGLYVETRITVTENGVAQGYMKDKDNQRLLVEVSLIKPGKKMYRITFLDQPKGQPEKKFYISQDELTKHFKNNGRSANEVFKIKQNEEQREAMEREKGKKLSEEVASFKQKLPILFTGTITNKAQAKGDISGAQPYIPGSTRAQRITINTKDGLKYGGLSGGAYAGPIAAKQALEDRTKKTQANNLPQFSLSTPKPTISKSDKDRNKTVSRKAAEQLLTVLKIYLGGSVGIVGLSGLMGFFT